MRTLMRLFFFGVILTAGSAALAYYKLNDIVKTAIVTFGPQVTKTDVRVASVSLSPFSGRGRIRGLVVGNPEGYKGPAAFTLGSVRVKVDLMSFRTGLLVVEEIEVEDPEVHLVAGPGGTNLQRIQKNVESYLPPSKGSKPTKVVVERFRVAGAKLHSGGRTLRVPDLEVRGLGRESGGVTAAEAGRRMLSAMTVRSLDVGAQIGMAIKAGARGLLEGVLGGKR